MSSLVSLVSGIGHPATLRVLQDLLHAVSELPVVVGDAFARFRCACHGVQQVTYEQESGCRSEHAHERVVDRMSRVVLQLVVVPPEASTELTAVAKP
jgi:hypothetical protein